MQFSRCRRIWELSRRCRPLAWMLAILFASAVTAFGTEYRTPLAIESNLLVFHGKVVFTQGTGGLTVLSLRTGQVIARKPLRDKLRRADQFLACPKGVLCVNYGQSSLLDPNTFEPLWTIEHWHSPVVEGEFIVSHDGYHTVSCHSALTGKELWSLDLEGGWNLALSGGIAVVSTVPFYDGQSVFWVIDARSGREMFHKMPPPDKQWCSVTCDGSYIYATTCPPESPNFREIPDTLLKFDLQGQEVSQVEFSSPEITVDNEEYKYPFVFEGKTFERFKNVRAAYPHELQPKDAIAVPEGALTFSLPSGLLFQRDWGVSFGKSGSILQMVSLTKPWKTFAPYVRPDEWLISAVETDGRILLCASGGQLECLDSSTGKSNWLYVFPTFRRVLSYSGWYIGTYWRSHETRRARAYDYGLSFLGEKSGSLPLPGGMEPEDARPANTVNWAPYAGSIVLDPAPKLLFEDLPGRVLRSTTIVAVSLLSLLVLFVWHRWWRTKTKNEHTENAVPPRTHYTIVTTVCLACFGLAACGLLLYGRVDPWCSRFFWAVVIVSIVGSYRGIRLRSNNGGVLGFVWLMFSAAIVGILFGSTIVP